MYVFINQLIKCETSSKCNFEFLFCYLAAWREVEQNKCKHDPQLSSTNKIRDSFNEMHLFEKAFVVSFVANQDVAVQNW